MKKLIDNFAAIVGGFTLALLLCSVCHEYGYFWVIGRSFQTFLSTTDYFNNAVLWLPAMAIVIYGLNDWDVMLGQRQLNPLGLNWSSAVGVLILFGFPLAAFFYFPPDNPYLYLLTAITLWLMYGVRLLPFKNTQSPDLQYVRQALVILPVIALVLFGFGAAQGRWDLDKVNAPFAIQTKSGDIIARNILRTLSGGLLVRDPVKSRIEFLRWENVSKVIRFEPKPKNEPLACTWFGWNCPAITGPAID